jgi:hypothetical protein
LCRWDISIKVQESGAFESFWDSIAAACNGLVFFYSGVSIVNFFIRWATRGGGRCA